MLPFRIFTKPTNRIATHHNAKWLLRKAHRTRLARVQEGVVAGEGEGLVIAAVQLWRVVAAQLKVEREAILAVAEKAEVVAEDAETETGHSRKDKARFLVKIRTQLLYHNLSVAPSRTHQTPKLKMMTRTFALSAPRLSITTV